MSDIVVYGKGKTGQCLINLLHKLGHSGVLYDDETGFDHGGAFLPNQLVLVSPGVPPYATGMRHARRAGAVFCGELEFCFPLLKGKCISVTGTNGKTTTCEMIYAALKSVLPKIWLLGNGGVPLSKHVLDVGKDDIVVLESSSFQLEYCGCFAPYISVFTNFAPDHLNWHGSLQRYSLAKQNNFVHQKNGFALFNFDDENVRSLSENCQCTRLFYSTCNAMANCYFDGNNIVLHGDGKRLSIPAPGFEKMLPHNLSNALAALLACCCAGAMPSQLIPALCAFKGLPHRMQTVGRIDGVTFIDDSKATNVHATVSALHCFSDPIALILGGSDKGEAFDPIFNSLGGNAVCVAAAGATAQAIRQCGIAHGVDVEIFEDIREATNFCYHEIKNSGGGIVLMSNACASFDRFDGYEQRGDYFANIVREIKGENKKN